MRKNSYLRLITYFLLLIVLSTSTFEVQAQRKKDVEKARKLAKQGDQFFNKKDYQNAINKYAEAIALVPTFPDAHFRKGYAHYYLKEYDQSLVDFDAALSQGFETPLRIYEVRWYLNYQAKNFDAALSDALEASRLDPNNPNYDFALGDIYFQKKSYRDAVNYYKKGAQRDSSNPDVGYFMAVSYYNLGEYVEQRQAALDALGKNTKYTGEAYFYVADGLFKSKKFDEAIEYYEKAITAKPEFYGSYNALSYIYRSQNRFEEAIEVNKKGLKYFPKDSNLYIGLSWYYSLADRHQEAIIAAQSAINLKPDESMGYTNLCRAYNDTKQYQLAIQSCNNAMRLNPGDGETHLYLARAYEFLKQNDKAVENYKKAVDGLIKYTRENKDYSDGFYLLGNAYFANGKDNEAIEAYKKCLQLAPRFARARFALGYTYLQIKRKDLAREQYSILKGIDANLAEKLRVAIDGK